MNKRIPLARTFLIAVLLGLLAACGGGGDDGDGNTDDDGRTTPPVDCSVERDKCA